MYGLKKNKKTCYLLLCHAVFQRTQRVQGCCARGQRPREPKNSTPKAWSLSLNARRCAGSLRQALSARSRLTTTWDSFTPASETEKLTALLFFFFFSFFFLQRPRCIAHAPFIQLPDVWQPDIEASLRSSELGANWNSTEDFVALHTHWKSSFLFPFCPNMRYISLSSVRTKKKEKKRTHTF